MSFALSSSIRPPTARLDVHGELDLFTATQVGRTIDLAMEQGCREVLVDASEVTFVNGSALGVLVRNLITLTSSAGSLQFVSVSPKFERLCQLTGIDEMFTPGNSASAWASGSPDTVICTSMPSCL